MNKKYLEETTLLDFNHPTIQALVDERGWKSLSSYDRIGKIYHFVQNEILFGYNKADDIPASAVLADGYGQCNTKGTLLMALFRSVGIPARFHGFTINNELQRGPISEFWLSLATRDIIHSWVEIYYEGQWLNLEGFILDDQYLSSVQEMFPDIQGDFCGYGVGVKDLRNPPIQWQGKDTYIQKEGINKDFGVFDSPDDFYEQIGGNLSGLKALIYQYIARHSINRNVTRIRNRQK